MDQDFDSAEDDQLPTEPQAVIEYIRRIEYGVGANLSGEGALILKKVSRKYGRLLSTVANELNSEDNHFLLELIQNAQDNKYAEGVEPAIAFRASPDLLVVENNELGFTPQNVKSLCSAAESTKTDKTIYIGEKGIGFKSVFKVTDAPEVHSNGFHFRFLRSYGGNSGLGYILPHWHEPTPVVKAGVTTLILPAKPGFRFEDFSQLNPSLLLFLGKLRRIEVEKDGVRTAYRRIDDARVTRLVTEVRAGDSTSATELTFITADSTVSMADIVEERRKGVTRSKLTLAFPLNDGGTPKADEDNPVFAFLPVADYGFRFILHADFILTSSRESIQEPLRWNKRLRDSVADAFLQALAKFKSDKKLRTSFFEFLPRKGEVKNEFFKAASTQILARLQEAECVLCESGSWKRPADVLLASSKFRELVPSSTLQELFGMDYPHLDITVGSALLAELGCHELLIDEVCSILSKHRAWFDKRPQTWKAAFYAYLSSISNQSALVSALKEVPCVPLANGKLMAPGGESAIFFPLRGDSEYGFEHELNVLHPAIFTKASKEGPQVERLFTALGVQRDDPYAVIHSYILPRHQEDGFGGASDDTLIAHLRYVKERWGEYKAVAATRGAQSTALRDVRTQMYVGTKAKADTGGWQFKLSEELYLSKEFQPSFSPEDIAGDDVGGDLLVSARYLSEGERSSPSELAAWRVFLGELGVASRPRVHRSGDGDARCAPETLQLLNSPKKSVRKAMLEALERDWATFDEYTKFSVTLGRSFVSRPSQFIQQVRSMVAPTKRRNVFRVSEAYADVEEVRSFFGESANYIDARLTNPSFLAACGITYRVDAQACLRRLREGKAGAKLSRDQLRHIFNRLEESWRQEQSVIEHAFRTEQLLPLAVDEKTRWFSVSEVTWRSPPAQVRILEKLCPSLANRYFDHLHFFTRLLRVQLELPVARWVDALSLVRTLDDPLEQQRTAGAIYQRLSNELERGHSKDAQVDVSWLTRFATERLFFTRKGTLVGNSSKLFRGDVPELVERFQDAPGLEFLGVPADQLPKVAVLLDKVGVRSLSESVDWRVAANTVGTMNRVLTEKVRSLVHPVARVVYWFGHSRFKAAVQAGAFRMVGGLTVLDARTLEMDAMLEGHARKTVGDAVLEGGTLYLRVGAPAASDQVARELRKLFALPESATDIFTRLILSNSKTDSDEYLRIVKHIEPLPEAEEQQLRLGVIEDEAEMPWSPERGSADAPELGDDRSNEGESEDGQQPSKRAPEFPAAPGAKPTRTHGGAKSPGESSDVGRAPIGMPSGQQLAPGQDVNAAGEAPGPSVATPSWNDAMHTSRPREGAPTLPLVGVLQEALRDAGGAPNSTMHFDVKPDGEGVATRSRGGSRKRARVRQGRMRSYAEPAMDTTPGDSEEQRLIQERKDAVDVAAVRCALASPVLTSRWGKLTQMDHSNPGFDIQAEREDGTIEFVEVKGRSGEWGADGVELTPRELEKAYLEGSRYWLCVVENALSASPRLYLVQGPYPATDRFCFDANWKSKAVASATSLSRPAAGLYVTVPGRGKGKILSVKGTATLSRMHIFFDDGKQSFKVYEPGKMTLSRE